MRSKTFSYQTVDDYPGQRFTSPVLIGTDGKATLGTENIKKMIKKTGGFEQVFSTSWAKPLLAFGALASPDRLIPRLLHPEGTVILPARMTNATVVWGDGERLTLSRDSSGVSHQTWIILLPATEENADSIDMSEGRGYGFYDLVYLKNAYINLFDIKLSYPVTYLGAKYRQPVDITHISPPYKIIPPDIKLTQLPFSSEENELCEKVKKYFCSA